MIFMEICLLSPLNFIGYYWKVKGKVLLNVTLSVGLFVECKLGVM